MNDQELREQFATWARPLHDAVPPPAAVITRRATRRTARIGAAWAAGLVLMAAAVTLIVVGVPGGPGGPSRPAVTPVSHGPYPFPPDSPYLATLAPRSGRMVVRNAGTGATLGTMRPGHAGGAITWVAAAADDRLFVYAEQASRTGKASFYALRLNDYGLGSVQNLPWAGVTGQIYGLAVSPDGSAFAVATLPLTGQGSPARVQVFGIDHQRERLEWTSPDGGAGALSWARQGTLAVYWQDAHRDSRSGLRILHVPRSGSGSRSLLGASRLAVPEPQNAGAPQLTGDGATVLWDVSSGRATWLDEFSAATGRLLRRFPMASRGAGDPASYCGVLWASRTGGSVLTQCGGVQEWISAGRVTRVRLAMTIPASMVGEANSFAW